MRESLIEKKLKITIEQLGGRCLKFVSPGACGVPDRICLLPGGHITFVETKSPGKKLKPLQVKRKKDFERLGFQVKVIDSEIDIKNFLADFVEKGGAE